MHSPAAAFAWELSRRHRWAVGALGGYVLWVAAFKLLVLGPGYAVRLMPPDGTASAVVVPFSVLVMFLLAAFSFGFDGDLVARRSMYPARMFALPATTAGLAGWPMLYGTVVMAGLWLSTALLARWPWGIELPFVWPALFTAAILAWTQALAWMPYGLRGLRVVLAVLLLVSIDVVIVVAVEHEVPGSLMIAMLLPQLPLAYLCAYRGVARARRGDIPDWRGGLTRLGRFADVVPRRRRNFASPGAAQRWLEWRGHGMSLPVWVAIVLPFELAVLWVPGSPLVLQTLLVVLLTPPFMAAVAAATAGKSGSSAGESYGISPFLATRPLSSASLAGAKLTAALWSTLVTWSLVVVAVPLALTLSGTWPVVNDWVRGGTELLGPPRVVAVATLGLLVLVAATWKQLVQGLCIGLAGRASLVKASVVTRLSVLVVLLPLLEWIHDGRRVVLVVRTLPWVLAAGVGVKIAAAAWVAARLHRDRLFGDRALLVGAAGWLALVLSIYGGLVWLADLPPFMTTYSFALIAVLAVPLTRPAAAPLALAWNRHRGKRQGGAAESSASSEPERKMVVGAVWVLIALPAALAFGQAASFYARSRTNGSLVSAGQVREYLLYVPQSYDASEPTPLVIGMHGGATWPAHHMGLTGWNRLADENGFIVVYPAGTGRPRSWETFAPDARLDADVRFVSELIDTLQSQYNIDASRIYAEGLSNGGGMAFVLSCRLSDRIAAVGMVAPAQTLPPDWCRSSRPVPVIALQAEADPILPWEGGPMGGPFNLNPPVFPAVRDFVAAWAQRNRCVPDPVASAQSTGVTRFEFTDCAGDATVLLFAIHGGGHTWPGGEPLPEWFLGPTPATPDATRQMWEFFREHPLVRD